MEAKIVPKAGYPLLTVLSAPFARSPLAALRSAGVNLIGTLQSLAVVARARPDVVIATGGYVCFPVVVAARVLRALRVVRAPIALLEPNATPGLTNKLLAPLVDEVWGAQADGDPRFRGKYVRTGVPIRSSLLHLPQRDAAIARLGLDGAKRTLIAMGGSLGARSINDAVRGLDAAPEGWQVLLVAGDDALADAVRRRAAPGVTAAAYLDDPADAFAAADLLLARSGASTVAEVRALGLAALFVPYPHHADNHQAANAASLARDGGAVVIADKELDARRLSATLASLSESGRLATMQAAARAGAGGDAAAAIVARIRALAARRAPA
jgi:UDP-N-acetylglucosamine--N-acetylmuramyl-(pentapeptide) pyrophosphoryl-undecaprenol N-acetylglucosamine transferase